MAYSRHCAPIWTTFSVYMDLITYGEGPISKCYFQHPSPYFQAGMGWPKKRKFLGTSDDPNPLCVDSDPGLIPLFM